MQTKKKKKKQNKNKQKTERSVFILHCFYIVNCFATASTLIVNKQTENQGTQVIETKGNILVSENNENIAMSKRRIYVIC